MPLSRRVTPSKGLPPVMAIWRKRIDFDSMSGSEPYTSCCKASASFANWLSAPITCNLSPGNTKVLPSGMFMRRSARRMLLTCTPKRWRSSS